MLHLAAVVLFPLKVGKQRNKGQYGAHQDDIRHDDPGCLQPAHFNSASRNEKAGITLQTDSSGVFDVSSIGTFTSVFGTAQALSAALAKPDMAVFP
jgi:hypothetical protein